MRLSVIAVGRLKDGVERKLFDRYAERLQGMGKSLALGPISVNEFSESKSSDSATRQSEESRLIAKALPEGAFAVLLDETGPAMTSAAFANLLRKKRDDGIRDMAFLIGGPDGHGAEIRQTAQSALSLSAMTLPHGLARVMLAEQLYRAATIIAGHPYHRS